MEAVDGVLGDARDAFAAGRIEAALTLYRGVLAVEPGHARAHGGVARCLASLGQIEDAIVVARRTVELAPLQRWGHLALATILYDADRMADLVAVAAVPDDVVFDAADRGSLLGMAAYAHLALDQDDETCRLASEAMRSAPTLAFAHGALATALGMKRRLGEALIAIDRALELEPDDDVHRAKRAAIIDGVAALERALADARHAELRPPSSTGCGRIGALLDLLGR